MLLCVAGGLAALDVLQQVLPATNELVVCKLPAVRVDLAEALQDNSRQEFRPTGSAKNNLKQGCTSHFPSRFDDAVPHGLHHMAGETAAGQGLLQQQVGCWCWISQNAASGCHMTQVHGNNHEYSAWDHAAVCM
jgi:hypothetical protein